MENSKKRKLSGTILAGTFAVPAALSTAQQNITSANLFTDVCSSASSFFTKKAEESTFSFLASRIGTCISITVLLAGIYMLYKELFPEKKNEDDFKKYELINENTEKNEENKKVKSEEVTKDILKEVLKQLEAYIKEFIREKIKEIFNAQEENKNLVNEIYNQLDLNKISNEQLNTEGMLNKNKEEAKTIAVDIVKNKIKETYKEDVEKFVKEKKNKIKKIEKIKKIQAVYRGESYRKRFAAEQKIIKIYEENKEFLENFSIKSDQTVEFVVAFSKKANVEEEKASFVDVSAKLENNSVKVTFKKDGEEKILSIEKSEKGSASLNKLVELSKQYLKSEIKSLYLGNNKEQILENFEIDEEKAKEFVEFKEKNEKNKVSVTSESKDEKITFTFKNGGEEKNFEVPVTKDGYKKLENLINLAKEYNEKKVKEINNEKKININGGEHKNENLDNEEMKEEDGEFEKFKKFKEEFQGSFAETIGKDYATNYLSPLKVEDNSIELVYKGWGWGWGKEYPLSISYNKEEKKFELYFQWTYYGRSYEEKDAKTNAKEAVNWFLEKAKIICDKATGKSWVFYYNKGKLVLFDGNEKISLENSGTKITVND